MTLRFDHLSPLPYSVARPLPKKTIRCSCGATLRVDAAAAPGSSAVCHKCGQQVPIHVPQANPSDAVPQESTEPAETPATADDRLTIVCSCGTQLRVPVTAAGKSARCPNCQQSVLVAGGADPSVSPTSSSSRSAEDKITVTCACGAQLRVAADAAGKTVQCPKCTDKIQVPDPSAAIVPPPVPVAVVPDVDFSSLPATVAAPTSQHPRAKTRGRKSKSRAAQSVPPFATYPGAPHAPAARPSSLLGSASTQVTKYSVMALLVLLSIAALCQFGVLGVVAISKAHRKSFENIKVESFEHATRLNEQARARAQTYQTIVKSLMYGYRYSRLACLFSVVGCLVAMVMAMTRARGLPLVSAVIAAVSLLGVGMIDGIKRSVPYVMMGSDSMAFSENLPADFHLAMSGIPFGLVQQDWVWLAGGIEVLWMVAVMALALHSLFLGWRQSGGRVALPIMTVVFGVIYVTLALAMTNSAASRDFFDRNNFASFGYYVCLVAQLVIVLLLMLSTFGDAKPKNSSR